MSVQVEAEGVFFCHLTTYPSVAVPSHLTNPPEPLHNVSLAVEAVLPTGLDLTSNRIVSVRVVSQPVLLFVIISIEINQLPAGKPPPPLVSVSVIVADEPVPVHVPVVVDVPLLTV